MSLKKNLVYNIILNVTNVLYPLITVPYVSRILGVEGIGITGFVITFAGYFALLAALGIPSYGVREISKIRDHQEKTSSLFSELFSINIISSLFFSLLYILCLFFVPKLAEIRTLALIAGIQLFLSPFNIDWYFSGKENFRIIAIRSIVIKMLTFGALFLFVKNREDLIAYLILNIIAQLGNQLWNFFALIKSNTRIFIKLKGLKKHFKPLFYLYASAIAISIYTILDTLMLGFLSNYEEVGYYTSATKVSRLLLFLVTGLGPVVLPRMAYYSDQKMLNSIKALISKSFSFVVFLSLPIATALILVAPDFVPFFFGKDFSGTIFPLQILSLLLIAIGLNNLTGTQILVGMGHDKPFMKAVLFGAITNFILNLLLIPRWGAVGSSIASVIAEFFITVLTTYYAFKFAKISFFSISIFLKNMFAAFVLIPLYLLLHLQFKSQWLLIGTFIITGSISYILIQFYLIKNEILLEMVAQFKSKIIRKH